jgi:hypothetical protein
MHVFGVIFETIFGFVKNLGKIERLFWLTYAEFEGCHLPRFFCKKVFVESIPNRCLYFFARRGVIEVSDNRKYTKHLLSVRFTETFLQKFLGKSFFQNSAYLSHF